MQTLNQLSREKYGKDYRQLPDDSAEQDFISGEFCRINRAEVVKTVQDFWNRGKSVADVSAFLGVQIVFNRNSPLNPQKAIADGDFIFA